jgi:ubiquinone/menaquinone biosynthesis C-methylase UbiE
MQVQKKIKFILNNYDYDSNLKIYKKKIKANKQMKEIKLRKKVASKDYDDFLYEISKFHSINVMDKEIKFFLNKIPKNSLVCDVGGCWAWHWRNILKQRPDIKIFIVDLVAENFKIAKSFIGKNLNKKIFLINDDICDLNIKKKTFDAVWTVQTLQHVPDFPKAIENIYKILKNNSIFFNYNLNVNPIIKFIYKIIRKNYIIKGYTNLFYLNRSSKNQKNIIKKKFKNNVKTRYCELLFHPDLKLFFSGNKNSIFGKFDSLLSGSANYKKIFARQECFIVKKN